MPELEWVCCETPGCGKWRVLPEKVKAASLPDSYTCEMNSWDEKKIRKLGCNAPEETSPEEVFARLKKDAIRKKKKALAEAARKAERKRLASLGGENASAALATQIPTLATQGSSSITQASGGAGKSSESGGNKAATATKSRKRPVPQGLANAMPVALSGTSYMPLWYDACGINRPF